MRHVSVVDRAREFAFAKHNAIGHVRKYTGEPYVNHLTRVVDLLKQYENPTSHMLQAAWLHDTLEDTNTSFQELRENFDFTTATMVAFLTKPSVAFGDRQKRHKAYCDQLHEASDAIKTVKLADIIDNVRGIAEHDPKFARIYLPEKIQELEVLRGASGMWARARILVHQQMNLIGITA